MRGVGSYGMVASESKSVDGGEGEADCEEDEDELNAMDDL